MIEQLSVIGASEASTVRDDRAAPIWTRCEKAAHFELSGNPSCAFEPVHVDAARSHLGSPILERHAVAVSPQARAWQGL
jgi:hypothetical protein